MRKDDGTGLRGVAVPGAVSATKDGRAGRGPPDIEAPSGVSGTTPSPAAVALVIVTAVEVVPTVGDGEGARRGTIPTGVTTSCSFMSSASGNDASLL
jgi:hypothetical protein